MGMEVSVGPLRRIYNSLSPRRKRQGLLLLLLMLAGSISELVSLSAIFPFLALMANPAKALDYPGLQLAFSAVGWRDPTQLLLPATLLFALASVVAAAVRLLVNWASNKYAYALGFDLGMEVYRRTLHQPYSFHVSRNSSALISILDKVQGLIGSVILPLMQTVIAVTTSISIIGTLLYVNAKASGGASLCFATIYLLVSVTMRRRLRENSQVISRCLTKRVQSVQEGLGGIRDVLLDNTQSVYIKKFARVDSALRRSQATNAFISVAPRYVLEALGMVLVAVLAYALTNEPGGLATALPVLGVMALGAQKLLPLMQTIYLSWSRVAGNTRMMQEVAEQLEMPMPDTASEPVAGQPLGFRDAIELRDLSFRYGSEGAWTLKTLNLKIPKGARVGFIGKTGSGKSTTLDIIMGLLAASEGELRVDGQTIHAGNRVAWQRHVSHVPQAIYLADASLAENIAFGLEPRQIDEKRLRQAAHQAQIGAYIESLPAGYETEVGERGVRLSGGQRQRIGLARALYKQADVLILDEATSALDSTTEQAVMECIETLGAELTVLIIAHRITTLRMCDFVVRMDAGEIIEIGSYEDVLAAEKRAVASH